MSCAPVVIPTLNRIAHLERCIESLRKNTLAKETTLIISVDYPPSYKYEEGYKKICEYLKKPIEGFADVRVIYQKKNLGAFGKGSNSSYLFEYVSKEWDRIIFTEDDNEFSSYFLQYINDSLDIFEKDENVKFVCAESILNEYDDDVVKCADMSAYGYGTWIKKNEDFNAQITRNSLLNIAKDYRFLISLMDGRQNFLFSLQDCVLKRGLYDGRIGNPPLIDMTYKLYMLYYGFYGIFTTRKYLVRNWGYDGTGINCTARNIDVRSQILYNHRLEIKSPEHIRTVDKKYMSGRGHFLRACFVFVRITVWRIFNGT